MVKKLLTTGAMFALLPLSALAQVNVTVDGTRDNTYAGGGNGNVQTINTNFGKNSTGQVGPANGSELDNGVGEFAATSNRTSTILKFSLIPVLTMGRMCSVLTIQMLISTV
jgi:hypothetical protein